MEIRELVEYIPLSVGDLGGGLACQNSPPPAPPPKGDSPKAMSQSLWIIYLHAVNSACIAPTPAYPAF